MTRDEALAWAREIVAGSGVDRSAFVGQRGAIAERLWNDGTFTLGVEYGVLIALVRAFGITKDEVW